MNIAILDLGTNSIRLDIYRIDSDGNAERLHRDKLMVRLGEDVYRTGALAPAAKRRAWEALLAFRRRCDGFEVERVVGVATSALRCAKDGAAFAKRMQSELNFDVEVISGKQEAELILAGVLTDDSLQRGTVGFIDIGGGSTECGLCEDGKVITLESLPLGVARLQQAFLLPQATTQSIENLRAHTRTVLAGNALVKPLNEKVRTLGSSGTIKAIRKILEKRGCGKQIRLLDVRELTEEIALMTPIQLGNIPGLDQRRLDLIVPGALLLEELMSYLNVESLEYTPFALRDGLLHRELNR